MVDGSLVEGPWFEVSQVECPWSSVLFEGEGALVEGFLVDVGLIEVSLAECHWLRVPWSRVAFMRVPFPRRQDMRKLLMASGGH